MNLNKDILPLFEKAGWFPNRKVGLLESAKSYIPQNHPANEILEKFGGLKVGKTGTGITCAKSDVVFEFDDYVDEEIKVWSELLKTTFVHIAYTHNYHDELFIDSQGKLYSLAIHSVCSFTGNNFNEAMKKLLFGIRNRPMLLPDEEVVYLYGDKFTKESPEIYNYKIK